MKKTALIASLLCALALTGCARTAPVLNVTKPITASYDSNQVKNAILEAGLAREWVMTPVAPGIIKGHLEQRGHSADIQVNYSTTSYSINYIGSQNLSAGGGKIHRNYNRWVNNLDHDIQLRLASQQIK